MFREEIKGDTKTVTEFAFNEVSNEILSGI